MALLVTVKTSGSTYVLIFSISWLVAATIISSRGLGRVDPSSRGGVLRPRARGAAIATTPIVPTLLMVTAQSLRGLSLFGRMKRHSLYLLRAKRKGALVPGVILSRFQGEAMASGAASIHFTDPQKKVQGGLGLSRDSRLDGLIASILLTTFLLGLGTDGKPEAVAE